MSEANMIIPTNYVSGITTQSKAWYQENMPHSKILQKDYLVGFNLVGADFLNLKDEISASDGPEHGLKSRNDQLRWREWASNFCKGRFDGLPPEWVIEAVMWLKKTEDVNSKKRKRSNTDHGLSPKSVSGAISSPRIMWVAATPIISRDPTIAIEKNLVVKFLKTTEELQQDKSLPWFDGLDFNKYESSLGPAFVQSIKPAQQPDIHQGLVVMQMAKYICNAQLTVHAQSDFYTKFVGRTELETMETTLMDHNGKSPTFIVMYCDTAICLQSRIDSLYIRIERLRSCLGAPIVPIPSWSESLQSRGKVKDLKGLDAQARKRGTWRPVTCYPGGDCSLQDAEKTVHKRQESSGGEHVQVRPGGW